jgi:hypothetical protein
MPGLYRFIWSNSTGFVARVVPEHEHDKQTRNNRTKADVLVFNNHKRATSN